MRRLPMLGTRRPATPGMQRLPGAPGPQRPQAPGRPGAPLPAPGARRGGAACGRALDGGPLRGLRRGRGACGLLRRAGGGVALGGPDDAVEVRADAAAGGASRARAGRLGPVRGAFDPRRPPVPVRHAAFGSGGRGVPVRDARHGIPRGIRVPAPHGTGCLRLAHGKAACLRQGGGGPSGGHGVLRASGRRHAGRVLPRVGLAPHDGRQRLEPVELLGGVDGRPPVPHVGRLHGGAVPCGVLGLGLRRWWRHVA